MARPKTTEQADVLNSDAYTPHWRVLIKDGDGEWRDYGDQFGHDWVEGIDYEDDVDLQAAQATVLLRRDIKDETGRTLSLAPLLEASVLNRNAAAAYAPAIDARRAIRILTATTAAGTAPVEDDWQNVFEGVIDPVKWDTSPIVITARDLGGVLVDRYVKSETEYGADGGRPLEDVEQDILGDWTDGVSLYTPVPADFAVKKYKQSRVPVMEALETLSALRGWRSRYRWISSASAWLLTLFDPDREKTVPDHVFGPSRYYEVSKLEIDPLTVRNLIRVAYTDAATGVRKTVEVTDADSVERFGEQFMAHDLASDSPLDTEAEVTAYANYVLADLKDPKAEHEVASLYDWSIEVGDLIRFPSNGVHYDAPQDWAVVSVKHTIRREQHSTTVTVRGKPCGRYCNWIANENTPVTGPSTAGPSLIVRSVPAADTVTIYVEHTGELTVAEGTGPFVTLDDMGITGFPWVVPRPGIGQAGVRYTFLASLNGARVTRSADVPAIPSPTPITPPDAAYAGGVSLPSPIAVHAEYAGRIKLAAMPSARTDFDEGIRFEQDVTGVDSVRIIANVLIGGAAGSELALEYYNTDTGLYELAGTVDVTAPIDATGVQVGIGTLLPELTGWQIFRLVTLGGNGVASPVLGNVYVYFVPAAMASSARAGTLYLRDLTPSAGPVAGDFPMSAAMPAHTYGSGSNNSTGSGTVRALRGTKGTDTSGLTLPFDVDDANHPRDLFGGVFLSEPFTAAQSVAAGPWELVVVAERTRDNYHIYPLPVIYLLRLVAGEWTPVAWIYDAHAVAPDGTGETWMKGDARVSRTTVEGDAFDAEVGDVLAFEFHTHYDWIAGHATGHPIPDVVGGAATVGYDGATDIPLGSPDRGAWDGDFPGSYLKPPISLSVG